ncbi:phage major capsid protein [Acetivibrio straminisolvens]|jgi:HK97 family phage major capsid protein|uniref:phage major capsid protein n=1 Tax=Acetivibrio straminisolvens TaxID=253314 RepID=UPI00223F02B4|nr:phage major capsid protein [Acetivibrio straminisolvens]
MKKKLLDILAKKNTRKAEIVAKAEKTESVEELRSLNTELDSLNEEIRSLQEMINSMDDEGEGEGQEERTKIVNSQVPGVVKAASETRKEKDEEQMEYRKAFQQFVTRGTPIPAELREDEVTKTTDLTAAIPVPLANRIIETIESTGMILPLVTKSSFPAGVKIPVSSVKPVATWVSEGSGSDKQKKAVTTSIDFTHFKLRCEIAMTQEAAVMALPAFETVFVRQVSEAMTKAIESAIIKGAWNLEGNALVGPKGILDETPPTGQALTAKKIDYELLVNAEAALPQAYEANARWCMTKKTFMAFIGMTDANGQPIARINYGVGSRPERTLLGREVILCGDYMDSFSSTLEQGKVFAFLFNFDDYVFNTNYDLGVQRKQDWDTEDWLTKAVMACDGKVIDKNSLVTIAKA